MIYLEFPLWTLVSTTAFEDKGLPAALILLNGDAGRLIPIFTEDGLAEEFIVGTKMAGVSLLQLESPASLKEWLPTCPQKGITHVSVDPTTNAGRQGWQVPVEEFLDALP